MSHVEQLAEFVDRARIKALSSDTRQQLEFQVFAGEPSSAIFPAAPYWRRCESPEREGP